LKSIKVEIRTALASLLSGRAVGVNLVLLLLGPLDTWAYAIGELLAAAETLSSVSEGVT
jgi:hypothetical protein